MTNNEAISKIQWRIDTISDIAGKGAEGKALEDLEMAIQALEEIQQYRTLEQKLQSIYGENDGLLEIIVNGLLRYENAPGKAIKCVLLTDDDVETWEQLKEIGTIEELQELKEKNEPKKPEPIEYEKYIDVVENAKFLRGAYWCPNCKHTVRSGAYCDDCGQKLDWSE